ncbi:hypothetical protein GGI19_004876 [Coemansia pectinata]|uniref:Uncharacterized protein n=1 Tax=Coemansia pectinata TaxID=1052879 RepID=A0A9W8GT95_9FUNG|nr:hypothetical protein GGI19_004876 [Coemansia pectinata]
MKYLLVDVNGHEHIVNYGICGSKYLRQLGFSNKTCELIESTVLTKSYIGATDPAYRKNLKRTIFLADYWRIPLSDTEKSEFEKDPLLEQKIQLTKWEVATAKTTKDRPPASDTYRDMAIRNVSMSTKILD